MLTSGSILGSKWTIENQIGEGACAKVYSIRGSTSIDYDVVAKVIPLAKSKGKKDKEQDRICNTLNYEYILYTGLLVDFPLAPRRPAKFYGDDQSAQVRYLIMERLEMDLVGYSKSKSLSPSIIAGFGLQILEGLEWLHKKNFVFVDVKPENFMIKLGKLYFVDFGLVERYVAQSSVNARAPGTRTAFAGTPTFCSLSVHKGGVPTGADDVEAMGYVLLSLVSEGRMPWSDASSDAQCLQLKESCNIAALSTERNCSEIGQIITSCRRLLSGQQVDYAECRQLLSQMSGRKNAISAVGVATKATKTIKATSKPSAAAVANSEENVPKGGRRKVAAAEKVVHELELDDTAVVEEQLLPSKRARISRKNTAIIALKSVPDVSLSTGGANSRRAKHANVVESAPLDSVKGSGDKASADGPFTKATVDVSSASARSTRSSLSPVKESRVKTSNTAVKRGDSIETETDIDKPFSSASVSGNKADKKQAGKSFHLCVSSGPYENERFNVDTRGTADREILLVAGRHKLCGLKFTRDDYMSDRHFNVKVDESHSLWIQDNGSTNGTKVGGVKLLPKQWVLLKIGDVVDAGETRMTVDVL